MDKVKFLVSYREEYPKHYVQMIVRKDSDYYHSALKFCNDNNLDLNSNSKILYHYAFDIKDIPKCECGNSINSFSVNGNFGYNIFCGKSCSAKNKDNIKKRVKSRTISSVDTFKHIKSNIIKENIKISKEEFENFIRSMELDISNLETILITKYSDYYNFYYHNYKESLQEVTFNIKTRGKKKYCKECGNPLRFISFNRGYSNGCSNRSCYSKITSQTKRGKFFPIWKSRLECKGMSVTSNIDAFISGGNIDILCENCDSTFTRAVHTTIHNGCPNCSKSKPQRDITEYIESLGFEVLSNDRRLISPLELDIYIPSKNLAIEYCGLYWHSEGLNESVDRKYHYKKYKKCKDIGIKLITVFENEWISNKELVLSKIKTKLGIFDKKIRASECDIKEITKGDCELFMRKHHMQGYCGCSIRFGLYYEDELVSAMSFGKRNGYMEMIRYCNRSDIMVYGGMSKLFKLFLKDNTSDIKTFADLRWADGMSYENLGFKCSHTSTPNYYYYESNKSYNPKLYSRVNFQKHKLKDKLKIFDNTLTEHQNMYNNGYRCIWDCGNSVWIWN